MLPSNRLWVRNALARSSELSFSGSKQRLALSWASDGAVLSGASASGSGRMVWMRRMVRRCALGGARREPFSVCLCCGGTQEQYLSGPWIEQDVCLSGTSGSHDL